MYSAWQVGMGTFLGGALTATYCLRANYLARDDRRRARLVTILGIVAWLLTVGPVFLLSGYLRVPVVPLAEAALAFALVNNLQLNRADTPRANLHGNGRVALVALLGLGLSALALLVAFMAILAAAAP
jgi:hypothetical protein